MPTAIQKDPTLRKVRKTMSDASGKGALLDRLVKKLDARDRQEARRVLKKLDVAFVLDKAAVIRDTMAEIIAHRDRTPNVLLQRNVWAAVDAISLHLDYTGVTRLFQRLGSKIFRGLRFDDPDLVSLEYALLTDFMGGTAALSRLGLLSRDEVQEVFAFAEKHRAAGLRHVASRGFSCTKAMTEACGRPDMMLETVIHSPAAAKTVISVVIFLANLVAVGAGILLFETIVGLIAGGVVGILTAVTIWIVVGNGC